MRSLTLVVVCLILPVLLTGVGEVAAAGNPVTTKHALDLQLSGQIDIGAVYRSHMFNGLFYGPHHAGAVQEVSRGDGAIAEGRKISPSIFSNSGTMFVIDPQLSLSLKATMQENVVALVELATPYYVIGDEGGASTFREKPLDPTGLYGSERYRSQRYIEVEQVWVEFRNLIVRDSGLNLRLGITDYAHDFRGNGHPFLIDVQNAENPFLSPTGSAQYYIVNTATGNPVWDANAGATATAGYQRIDPGPFGRNVQDAAGALITYRTEGSLLGVDAYVFDIFETYEKNRDDWVIGTTASIYFDDRYETGKISPTALLLINDGSAVLATLGLGAQFFPLTEQVLELYGEGYFQFGHYAKDVVVETPGVPAAQSFGSISQRHAYAFYVGGRLQAPKASEPEDAATKDFFGSMRPYLDLSYVHVSGDDRADNSKNESFVSLENNNQTLIVESSYWGLDIDTNYLGVRITAGFYPLDRLHVAGTYANFHYQNGGEGVDNRVGQAHSKIGDEVDLVLTYEYSTHVKFRCGTGFLWDARALGTTRGINLTMAQVIVDF